LISAGLAGALHPDLQRGDLLFADAILGADGSRVSLGETAITKAPAAEVQAVGAGPSQPHQARVHHGKLLTVDRVVRLPHEKRALGQKHQALAVDMESLAVAAVCAREQTNFLSVRIISDGVDDELPAEIERVLDQKTAARRAGAALGAILNRPSSLGDMLKLKEQALTASDQLAQVLAQLVQRLQ
jgi:adenosylhomocysteine nucleosidase